MAYRNLPEMPCGPILELHGQRKRFHVPFGLKQLLEDMTREVLRFQPPNIYEFLALFMDARLARRVGSGEKRSSSLDDANELAAFLASLDTSQEEAEKHATVIQSAFRGYQARKKVKEEINIRKTLAAQKLKERHSDMEITQITEHNATDTELKAATTIQAAFRGMHVRKTMKAQREGDTEDEPRKSKKLSGSSKKKSGESQASVRTQKKASVASSKKPSVAASSVMEAESTMESLAEEEEQTSGEAPEPEAPPAEEEAPSEAETPAEGEEAAEGE